MSNKLNYDRDKVWQNIVKKQKEEKKRRYIFIWLSAGIAGICLWSVFQFGNFSNKLEVFPSSSGVLEKNEKIENSAIDKTNISNQINKGQVLENEDLVSNSSHISTNNSNHVANSSELSSILDAKDPIVNVTQNNNLNYIRTRTSDYVIQDTKVLNENTEIQSSEAVDGSNKAYAKTNAKTDNTIKVDEKDFTIASLIKLSSRDAQLDHRMEVPNVDLQFGEGLNIGDSRKGRKAFYVSNTISFGSQKYRGPIDYVESRQSAEKLNFINSTAFGLQFASKRNLLFRIGLNVDVISHTYEHIQGDVINRETQVQHDTAVVYQNAIVSGLRIAREEGGRRIVKNNEVLKFGIPIGLGYKMNFGNWSLRNYVNAQVDFKQQFYGVIKSVNEVHLFDQQLVNDSFYKNYWSSKLSAELLLDKHLSENLSLSLGVRYSFPELRLSNSEYGHDYKGLGISFGLSSNF